MSAIAAEALDWIGTPFVWGQSQKGVGCDCKGLVAGVARALGRPEADSVYAVFASYRVDRPVPGMLLIEGFEALFDRVPMGAGMEPGDLLLLRYGRPPVNIGHMAIFAGNGRAVHSSVGSRVKSRELRVLFHDCPLHSVWRWRRLTDAD